jgi:hypothetical protein
MYDNDEPEDDDEKALREAIELSKNLAGGGPEDAQPQPAAKVEEKPPENVDLDADVLKDVIGDLGIDLDDG